MGYLQYFVLPSSGEVAYLVMILSTTVFEVCMVLFNIAFLQMLDADRFKSFNDRWGHPAGDAVPAELGAVMRGSLRAEDVPCRYGGEEFAAVLEGADLDTAAAIAERIRERFARVDLALYSEKDSGRNRVAADAGSVLSQPRRADA